VINFYKELVHPELEAIINTIKQLHGVDVKPSKEFILKAKSIMSSLGITVYQAKNYELSIEDRCIIVMNYCDIENRWLRILGAVDMKEEEDKKEGKMGTDYVQ